MIFSYKQSFEKSISDELKKRFQEEVEALGNEGFSFFSLHQEVIWPFSVITFFPIYVLMASNEYVRVETPLRITSYHLLYVSHEAATFAYVYGMGCKFYTSFTDGTWLVSNTVQNIQDEKVIALKRDVESITTEQVWEKHQAKIQEYEAKGKQLATHLSFDNWVEVERRFDQSNVIPIISMGVVWMAFLSWAIYWFVKNGVSIFNTIF